MLVASVLVGAGILIRAKAMRPKKVAMTRATADWIKRFGRASDAAFASVSRATAKRSPATSARPAPGNLSSIRRLRFDRGDDLVGVERAIHRHDMLRSSARRPRDRRRNGWGRASL